MCSYCDYTSITRANVKKHELAVHVDPDRRDFECIICAKKFKTSSNLIEHSKIHDNESFKCSDCLKTFKSKRGLEHHRRTHTGELFSCQVCGEQFLSKNSVNRHHRDIHGYLTTNEEKNKCTKKGCLAEFSSQEDYRQSWLRDFWECFKSKTKYEMGNIEILPLLLFFTQIFLKSK